MRDYNEKTAFKYDSLRSGHSLERKYEIVKSLINKVKNDKTKLIGEIGYGSGKFSYLIANEFKNCQIEGFELNKGFVKYAKRNFKAKNLKFHHLNIEESKLPKEFDILLTIDLLHHLKNLELSIENIQTSLKERGGWIIIEPNIYNIYIFLFQLLAKNESLFYQLKTEKQLAKEFVVLEKKCAFITPFWLKNPPNWFKNLERKFENRKIIGGSVIYLLKKSH